MNLLDFLPAPARVLIITAITCWGLFEAQPKNREFTERLLPAIVVSLGIGGASASGGPRPPTPPSTTPSS